MESEILQGFIKQSENYLPKIRGVILVCAREGNAYGELNTALRQIISLKEAASIVGLEEVAKICAALEAKITIFADLKQPMTDQQSHQLLDRLNELETATAKIYFNTEYFSDSVADFIEESFEQLGFNQPVEEKSAGTDEFEEEFEIDDEMLEIFALEVEDIVRNISINLAILGETPNHREALLEIRRNAHTLKGSAGIVGLKKLAELAHKVEDLLDFLTENDIESNENIFELLLTSTDCFEALTSGDESVQLTKKIARIYENHDEIKNSLEQTENLKKNGINGQISPVEPENYSPALPETSAPTTDSTAHRSVVRVSLEKLDELVKIMSGLVISRSVFEQRLAELERQIEELHHTTRRLQSSTNKLETGFEAELLAVQIPNSKFHARDSGITTQDARHKTQNFDTLEFDRYTEFHETTRELIESASDTSAINSELDSLKDNLETLFDNQRRLIDEMQEKLLRLRMVFFGSLSMRLQRTVRVTGDEEGKSAELLIEGENLEIDTQLLDSLIEPLLHLLRNAVAHGIELPETRRLLGKPEKGKILLRIVSEGTHVVLTISDDGRGISAAALKENAVQIGFVSQEKADLMTDAEALELTFLPGLTTAKKLSQVAGRGIGMNIVKTGIARQQGTVSIASETHKGTTFTLRLPAALAVTRALLVKAGEKTFAFPLKLVKNIRDVAAEELKKDQTALQIGNVNYKILRLNNLLDLPPSADSITPNLPILLLETIDQACALVVDEIIKTDEIVIKSLGHPLQNLPELLGAAILGDGSVVPVLDLVYLLKKVQSPKSKVQSSQKSLTVNEPQTKDRKLTVLIVDDSPSVRHLNSNLIKNAGWMPVVAKDGLEALEILQTFREPPDIILTDVEMPRMNGYELLATLKQQESLREIPVIMITSRAGDKHRLKAINLGVSEYLTKPFDDTRLTEIIRKLT